MAINPLRADPSRTSSLRRVFENAMIRRFNTLLKRFVELTESGLSNNKYEHSIVMHVIKDPPLLSKLKSLQEAIKKKNVLKLEDEFHITVMPGLHTTNYMLAANAIQGAGPIRLSLGEVSVFRLADADVVMVEVVSKDLHTIHNKLKGLKHTTHHRKYRPHITLGFLKKGDGHRAATKLNKQFYDLLNIGMMRVDELTFSTPERNRITFSLGHVHNAKVSTDTPEFKLFMQILDAITNDLFVSKEDYIFLEEYIAQAYEQGLSRAFDEVNKPSLSKDMQFYEGTRAQFLKDSFGSPATTERITLLASRSMSDVDNILSDIKSKIVRELVDGMIRGLSPREVARSSSIKTIIEGGKNRALTIARTETLRAHNEGMLDAMEEMGVEDVGVLVEMSTAEDGRVCPICAPYNGTVMKIKDAHGLFPIHPNCRCVPIPAGFNGEKVQTKKVNKLKGIVKALRVKLTSKQKAAIAEAKRRSTK